MADATSTITLRVDSTQAKQALSELTGSLNALKSGLANLGTLTDSFKRQQTEIQALKAQVAELTSGITSGARETEAAVKRSGTVWASYRMNVDGVSYSYKELSKVTKDQVNTSIAATEASKKEMAERKAGLLQVKAAVLDLSRAEKIAADARTQVPQLKSSKTLITQSLAANGVDVNPAREAGLAEYFGALQRATDAQAAFNAISQKSSASVANVKTAVAALTAANPELQRMGNYYRDLEKKSNALAEAHTKSAQRSAEHTKQVKEHSNAQAALHSTLRGVAGGLDHLWLTYGKFAGAMAAAYGTVKLVRESLSKGMDLNYNVQFAAALSDSTTDNASTVKLKDSILERLPNVVKDIPYTTNEAAQALHNMAQAGVEVEQGLQLIPTAAKAAIMGETDLSDAARDLVSVMEVFDLKSANPLVFAKNFQHVGDVTASVASSTSASFNDVIQSFKAATGVANLYNISLEEVAATVDMLGKAGINGSKAGTYTRNLISNLYNPQSEQAKVIKQSLGVSAFDSTGKMKDYVTVVNELFVALSKLNDQGLTQAFERLFNERSTRPAGQLVTAFQELATRINDLRGAEGTLDGFITKLEGAAKIEWQDALAKGSDLLATSLKKSEQNLTDLADEFRKFVTDESIRTGLQELIGLTTKVAGGLLDAIKNGVKMIQESKDAAGMTLPKAPGLFGPLANIVLKGATNPKGLIDDRPLTVLNRAYESYGKSYLETPDPAATPKTGGRSTVVDPKAYLGGRTGGKNLNIPDPKAEAEARRQAKFAAKTREDEYSSGIKQEGLKLGWELLKVEEALANQDLNSVEATRKKNEATTASLLTERELIAAALVKASAAAAANPKDDEAKLQVEKYQNDLQENAVKLLKQEQQALLDTAKARTADRVAIEDTNKASERYLEDLRFEVETVGKTALEVRKLRIERERARAGEDLWQKLQRGQITPDQFAAEGNANEAKAEAARALEDEQRTFSYGWKKAYQDYEDSATNAADASRQAFEGSMAAMEDALYTLATTGKLTFRDMTVSILKMMAQIAAKQAALGLMNMAVSALTPTPSLQPGNYTTAAMGSIPASDYSALTRIPSAQGNVFSGTAGLSQYLNTVQTSPKLFGFNTLHAFASGGVFAEAGPEAIMPLTRTASGDLGVRAIGSSAPNISVTNNVTVNSEGKAEASSQATGKQGAALSRMIEASTIQIITRELRPGGLLYGK